MQECIDANVPSVPSPCHQKRGLGTEIHSPLWGEGHRVRGNGTSYNHERTLVETKGLMQEVFYELVQHKSADRMFN